MGQCAILIDKPGKPLKVVIPYERTRKVAVMTPRSETEIKALKARGAASRGI